MRALLFNPWITDFAAFDHWTRPLNLLRLALLLRQCGLTVDLYDCLNRHSADLEGLRKPPKHRLNPLGCGHYYRESIPVPKIIEWVPRAYKRYGIPPERVEANLRRKPSPDLVIIPCMMTYWYPGAFEAIRMTRRLFPKACVVLGGIYATLCREHAERFSNADGVVIGRHWPEIVNNILEIAGTSMHQCEGDQSTWIDPAYDLLDGETCFPILTSTGCPCHCTYCATHSLWPDFIHYDPEQVANSVEILVKRYGATDLVFYDDALLMKKENYFIPLMENIIKRGIQVRFHTPNALHVRQIDAAAAYLLKKSGFTTIRLGLELVQRDLQRSTGAKVYTEEYLYAMQSLHEAGFTAGEIGTYLLFGLPNQSLDIVKEGCQIVSNAGSEIKLTMYSPVPGTSMFSQDVPDFQFDPREDPLLQNNSLAPFRSRSIPYEKYAQLKRNIAAINRDLRTNKPFQCHSG